jgi:glycosyltransferase involved in cell wall biosynthesis
MRPKVLHITTAKLFNGGVERFLLGLCQSLRADYKFALLSGAEALFSRQIYDIGCAVFPWEAGRTFNISAARGLSAAIQLYRPDILHFHDTRAELLSRLWPIHKDIKIIRTIHLSSYNYRWTRFANLRRFAYATIERFLNFHFSDAVIYPSRRGLQDALRHQYVPSRRAICIPNGIDLNPFEVAPDRRTRGNSVPILCTVSRLSPEKNIGLLFDAAALLKKRGHSFQLWVVGAGPEFSALEEKAKVLGLASQTRFWGWQENVAQILFQADIFALASWYEGGRSQAAMEAQAAGLPCVLSDVGDHASMLEEDRGLVFPEGDVHACADRLEFLLKDSETRQRMGDNARQFALHAYNLNVMADQYRDVYRDLLGGLTG